MTSTAILKEFDLDAPSLPKEARQSFRHQTRCVTALYERLFEPLRPQQKVWKVLIEVVPVVTKHEIRDLLGVLTIQVQGDPIQFLEATDSRKLSLAFNWLITGVEEVAKAYMWPVKPFEDAAAAVVAADFVNMWTWKAYLWNRTKTLYCDVEVEHGLREVKIRTVFKNPSNLLIGESVVCSTPPSEFAFVPLLGMARWIDENQVELRSKDGKKRWLATPTPNSASS